MKTIFIVAGGTGGHVIPALTIAKDLMKDYRVIWIGAQYGIENDLIPNSGITLKKLNIKGFRRKSFKHKFTVFILLLFAFLQSIYYIILYRPKVVVAFGGYPSLPMGIMSWVLFRKLIIHEQNSIVGLTNKILFPFAKTVLVAYDGVLKSNKTKLVGNPIRENLKDIRAIDERYNNSTKKLNILVLGGSLGAKLFNEELPEIFSNCNNINQIIHQVGKSNQEELKKHYENLKVSAQVFNFIEDIKVVYDWAHLIICRSGAMTVSEITTFGIAAIFIPYPYAVDNHQKYNVLNIANNNACILIEQKDFDKKQLTEIIQNLDIASCKKMAKEIKEYSINNSSKLIINIIKKIAS